MTRAASEDPRTASSGAQGLSSWLGAAAAAGLAAVALDAALMLARGARGPGLLAGALVVPALLGAALLLAATSVRLAPVLLGLMGFGLGRSLALGPRAATMPLAPWWAAILAGLALTAGLVLLRVARRGRPVGPRLLILGAVGAPMLFLVAATVERGRYQEPRLYLNLLVLGILLALARGLSGRLRERAATGLVALATSLGGAAAAVVLLDDGAAATAIGNSSLAEWPAAEIRRLVLPDLADGAAVYRHRPLLGSALGRAARQRLDERGGSPRGVLLVTIDAMRADLMDREVGGRRVLPTIEALAAGGMRFERAYAPAPMTQFSVFAMLSGWYPSQFLSYRGGFANCPLVTESLRAAGVETRGCYPKGMLTVGFEDFARLELGFEHSSLHPWDDLTVAETFERLRPRRGGRWFSYLHLMLPHYPYDQAPAEFRAGGSDFERFAAEVRACDDFVRELLGRFEAAGLGDMWVVLSADHGEEFGEHGAFRHSTQVFEESVHVPLVVAGRGVAAGRFDGPVSLVDLPPTLHQLFDLPDEGALYAGRSLLPLLVGLEDRARPETVLVENPPVQFSRANTRAGLVGPRLKLVADERSRRLMLFDLAEDPGETHDLSAERPGEARDLYAELVSRRRFGGEGATVFGTMADFVGLIDEAAREYGSGAVLSTYQWMAGLSLEDELRALSFFVEFPDESAARRIRSLLAARPEPEVALLLELLDMAERPSAPERFSDLAGRAVALRSPALVDASLALAARYGFAAEALADVAADEGPLRELSLARWRPQTRDAARIEELVDAAIASDSPWRQTIALDLALAVGIPVAKDRLLTLLDAARIERQRVVALRSLERETGESVHRRLVRAFAAGGKDEAAVAARILAFRDLGDSGLLRFVCAEAKDELEGFSAPDGLWFSFAGERAAAPLPRPEQAARAALFLDLRYEPGRRLRLRIGAEIREFRHGPSVPGDPIVIDLPPGRASRIIFEVLGDDDEPAPFADLRYAGSLCLPRP